MEAKELRIGNWAINPNTGEPSEINGIDMLNIVERMLDNKVQNHEPIPLTEEWLLKFGAIQNPKIRWYFTIGKLDIYMSGIGLFYSIDSGEVCRPIKYVHEFQNRHFSLTGEELILING